MKLRWLALIAPVATGCAVVIGLDEPSFEPVRGDGGLTMDDVVETPDACATADLTTSESCGRCGRSCFGRACREGMCEPEMITRGHGQVFNVAVDDEAVYFTSFDQWLLGRVDKSGGGAVTYLLPEGGLREPTAGLVADGPWIYASAYTAGSGDGARRLLKDGGGAERIDGCNTAWSLSLDATNVYWITGQCGGKARVRRRAKDDPDAATVTSATDPSDYSYAMYGYQAIDDTDIYWVSQSEIRASAKNDVQDAVTRQVFERGSSTEVFRAIAVSDRVYAMLGGRIIAVPKTGAKPGSEATVLDGFPPGKDSRAGLVVQGGLLYFTAPDMGIVGRIATTGGAVEVFARDQAGPTGLALDAKYVYWSNANDGSIWRAAR